MCKDEYARVAVEFVDEGSFLIIIIINHAPTLLHTANVGLVQSRGGDIVASSLLSVTLEAQEKESSCRIMSHIIGQ